jgi:hypothetical protein
VNHAMPTGIDEAPFVDLGQSKKMGCPHRLSPPERHSSQCLLCKRTPHQMHLSDPFYIKLPRSASPHKAN